MLNTPISVSIAIQIEQAEVQAWLDMYAAIPPVFRQRFQPELLQIDGVVFTRCRLIPFIHFNSVLNLGMNAPATERQLDAILQHYQEAQISNFMILHNPHSQPPQLADWLATRGLRRQGGWERLYRTGAALTAPAPTTPGAVEFVTVETAEEWGSFLDASYGLPTKPWLISLVGRPGWTHAALRQEGRIVAVRSLFAPASSRWAWLGVEAPIPGIMGPSYAEDYALDYALVQEGLRLGMQAFVADIEAPAPSRDTPAYHHWANLGFTGPYLRTHYVQG